MPVFSPKPTAPPVATNPLPTALAPENKNIIVDSRYIPRTALLSHVEGTPWTVQYYSQVVDKDTTLSGQQVGQLGINQQYRLIKNFELRVTGALQNSQDTDSNSMILTGTSNVYPCLIPNQGDMFLADIGDGRLGVFEIGKVERKNIFKDTIHVIPYTWVSYATEERLTDFANKVVKTDIFVKERMLQDKYPFLAPEDYDARGKLMGLFRDMVPMYFKSFWDNEYTTLTVPEQDQPTYDPFLVTAVMAMVSTSDSPLVLRTRQLNCDGDEAMKAVSIWTALLERSAMQYERAFTRATTVMAQAFDRIAYLESINHSGIQYVVYPIDPERSIPPRRLLYSKAQAEQVQRPDDSNNISNILGVQQLSGLDDVNGGSLPQADIPKACATDYYVFTQAFYDDQRQSMTKLEVLVRDYLDKKTLDAVALFNLASRYPSWELIDQYYYGPILMILIRCVVEDF